MRNELVSVIMPAYNAEKYIAEAIDSVIRQTYSRWELIIVDDGSTDGTANLVKEYLSKDDRIKLMQQLRGGQGKARNTGLQDAAGDFVAFLDADDYWVPEKLSRQIDIMHSTNADLIFSDANVFRDQTTIAERIHTHSGYFHGKVSIPFFLSANQVPILTVLAKKMSVMKLNGFSETRGLFEDYDLWLRMLDDEQSFFGIDAPLAWYRVHPGSSSSGEGNLILTSINTIRNFSCNYPQYKTECDRAMVNWINEYLANNNVTKWKLAGQLIDTRNEFAARKISPSFWRWIYRCFGRNFFRRVFRLSMKRELRRAENKV